jgi:hypothetical protein
MRLIKLKIYPLNGMKLIRLSMKAPMILRVSNGIEHRLYGFRFGILGNNDLINE